MQSLHPPQQQDRSATVGLDPQPSSGNEHPAAPRRSSNVPKRSSELCDQQQRQEPDRPATIGKDLPPSSSKAHHAAPCRGSTEPNGHFDSSTQQHRQRQEPEAAPAIGKKLLTPPSSRKEHATLHRRRSAARHPPNQPYSLYQQHQNDPLFDKPLPPSDPFVKTAPLTARPSTSQLVSVGVQANTADDLEQGVQATVPFALGSAAPAAADVTGDSHHERSWSEPSFVDYVPSADDMFARRVRDAYFHKGLDLSEPAPGVIHSVTGYQVPPRPAKVRLPPVAHQAGRTVRPATKILPDLHRSESAAAAGGGGSSKRSVSGPTLTVPREFNFSKSRAREPPPAEESRPAKVKLPSLCWLSILQLTLCTAEAKPWCFGGLRSASRQLQSKSLESTITATGNTFKTIVQQA